MLCQFLTLIMHFICSPTLTRASPGLGVLFALCTDQQPNVPLLVVSGHLPHDIVSTPRAGIVLFCWMLPAPVTLPTWSLEMGSQGLLRTLMSKFSLRVIIQGPHPYFHSIFGFLQYLHSFRISLCTAGNSHNFDGTVSHE